MQKQSFAYILGWSQEKIAGWYAYVDCDDQVCSRIMAQ